MHFTELGPGGFGAGYDLMAYDQHGIWIGVRERRGICLAFLKRLHSRNELSTW